MSDFRKELESLINRHSAENGSNTPDFILAEYVSGCLLSFDRAVRQREMWYGRNPNTGPGGIDTEALMAPKCEHDWIASEDNKNDVWCVKCHTSMKPPSAT